MDLTESVQLGDTDATSPKQFEIMLVKDSNYIVCVFNVGAALVKLKHRD